MKRILAFVLVFTFIFMLAGCNAQERTKKAIFNLVEENYDEIVKACQKKDANRLCAIDGITEVDIIDGYVLVYCVGAGIVPSSQYYGFYYSEENLPVAVSGGYVLCDTANLAEEGSGYQYVEDGNVFYTEHIKGNIYFYSAAF